ncbi:hypothetical protein H8E88_08585 [candidate division KSB1 bacterium]|nr:hypothetical protein [candidate division KSB1 bacterium]
MYIRRIRNSIILTLLLFLIVSCSTLLGIKSPGRIQKSDAIDYLTKHNIDTTNVIFLKENWLDTLKKKSFKPDWESGFRPIQFKIFSKNDTLIFQYSTCECKLKDTRIYEQFPPKNITPIDTSYTIFDEQKLTNELISKKTDTDYIAIIYWATYTGIPGRKMLTKVERILRENKEKITIYKLNTDDVFNK